MKKYTDKRLEELNWAILVCEESVKQIFKWGIQNHSLFKWYTIAGEEFGSLAKAILKLEQSRLIAGPMVQEALGEEVIKEAIQVATLCLKIAEMVKGKER